MLGFSKTQSKFCTFPLVCFDLAHQDKPHGSVNSHLCRACMLAVQELMAQQKLSAGALSGS